MLLFLTKHIHTDHCGRNLHGNYGKTVTTNTGSATDQNYIQFSWKKIMNFSHSVTKHFRNFIIYRQIYKLNHTRILFWQFIKINSILNNILAIFNWLVRLTLCPSSNRVPWHLSVTSFHIIPWCFATEKLLMATDHLGKSFASILTGESVEWIISKSGTISLSSRISFTIRVKTKVTPWRDLFEMNTKFWWLRFLLSFL